MAENKLLDVPNSDSEIWITNIKVVHKVSYCNKCLRELDMSDRDIVKDIEGNLFCDCGCRREFHLERRQDMDDILSNFK